jgi:putative transcriptional regulator
MSVIYHPSDEMLSTYAVGAGEPATSLMVATHLTYCSECRAEVSVLESLGGQLLRDLPAAALDARALETLLARL